MDAKPKLTVSGYRGIWGKDLDEKTSFIFARSFGQMIKNNGGKNVIIGRDARKSGTAIEEAMWNGLEKEGIKVKLAGIIPTPSVLFLVKKLSYDGGIIITASHNPAEYNGFKFVNSNGFFISPTEIDQLEQIRKGLTEKEKSYTKENSDKEKKYEEDNVPLMQMHVDEIIKNINAEAIRNEKFKVALDPINSAGSIITQMLLQELDCETYVINEEQTGEFTHEPEPLIDNLTEIREAVEKYGADVGFAQDPDADRLVVVNEKSEILSEEYTLALAVKNVLKKEKGDVVINMSTSRMCEDIALSVGQKTHRTKVGELNVVDRMKKVEALIGGEGNGGVIYPKMNYGRDSLVGITLILELMATEKRKISEIADEIPKYFMKKDKMSFEGTLESLYEKMVTRFADASLNTIDGLRFDWPNSSWIHIRTSNTEPVIRIIGEAKNEERLNSLFEKVKAI